MMKNKKLYKVNIMTYDVGPEEVGVYFKLSRSVEVAAADASQAIRKVKYNLTKRGEPLKEDEFIDEVARLGVIEVK